jgi:hypothetical protein
MRYDSVEPKALDCRAFSTEALLSERDNGMTGLYESRMPRQVGFSPWKLRT